MKLSNFRKLTGVSALVFAAVLGTSIDVSGQTSRQERRIKRQQERIEKQREKLEAQRIREAQLRQRNNRGQDGVVVLNNRGNNRVNERAYGTSEAVRAAVKAGYQQGFNAGQRDRSRNKYNQSNVYRGTSPNPNPDDINQYEYNYRLGFLEGYEEGYRGRRQY
ncbi:MAG: hypothetical protein ACR2M8_12390 [Pyrinomonadaceae bacterium]|nr:hypothetical protein [Blastocatellia bacterium]